ncbi:MAG: NAD(P)H-dependent oxidoreductase subunit E [Thermodesulfovibrionales bacterium]|nr:NAD(P)H-dependent oxidoreductase subunit E [Thermodesulfovibrionales bacterium]
MSDENLSLELEKLCIHYKRHDDLLSFIKKVHEKCGYLSPENIKNVASLWNVSVGEIYGLTTFYVFLSTKPLGQNVVRVCRSTPCYLENCDMVIETIEKKFNIRPGGVTEDGKFSLQLVSCIGACDQAPAMLINDELYGNLTPGKIETILKGL